MSWYDPVAYFFAGAFLANAVPHYVRGVTGRQFPTPFAVPPGVGESSPLTNVVWGIANLIAAFLLLQVGEFSFGFTWSMLATGVGFVAMSVLLVRRFGQLYTPSH